MNDNDLVISVAEVVALRKLRDKVLELRGFFWNSDMGVFVHLAENAQNAAVYTANEAVLTLESGDHLKIMSELEKLRG